MIDNIKSITDKMATSTLGMTAVARAAAATEEVEVTWPLAVIAMA